MSELQLLQQRVDELERQLRELKDDRFRNLSGTDVERLKGYIIERTATGVSGSVTGAVILTLNGKRRAIPTYSNFPAS